MKCGKCTLFVTVGLLLGAVLPIHPSIAQDATPVSDSRVVRQDMVTAMAEIATINGDSVNVRSQPSRGGDIIAQYDQGAMLDVTWN